MGPKGRNKDARLVRRTSSIESTASINVGQSRIGSPASEVAAAEEAPPANLFDCSALIIHCRKHDRYALQEVSSKKPGLWFPFVDVHQRSHETSAHHKLKRLLRIPGGGTPKGYAPFAPLQCLQILRVQVPHLKKYLQRYTFFTNFTSNACCANIPAKEIKWVEGKDLSSLGNKLWGPEPIGFIKHFGLSKSDAKIETKINETDLRDAIRVLASSKKNVASKELMTQVGADVNDILKWYSEYLQHCWPAQAMTFLAFHTYMMSIGYFQNQKAAKESIQYFRAFNYSDSYFLGFKEFILGIAASDKKAAMKGLVAEIRCGYIMRFYDVDGDKYLNVQEMSRLIQDAESSKTSDNGGRSGIQSGVKSGIGGPKSQIGDASKTLGELKMNRNSKISEKELVALIGSLKIRGTSSLFRSNVSTKNPEKLLYKSIDTAKSMDQLYGRTKSPQTSAVGHKCIKCRDKKYTLASHQFKLNPTGLWTESKPIDSDDTKGASKVQRRASIDFFADNLVNQMLDMIRQFSDFHKVYSGSSAHVQKPKDYLKQMDRKNLEKGLIALCDMAEEIIKREPRMLKVTSPCVVFGDIHGNLHDLMLYERLFWKKGPFLEAWTYLFLGDYVDRGIYSLEVAIYLLASKVQAPTQFFLLRGNHEVRPVNRGFTFYKELEHKLGSQLGPVIWERFNKVFDCLPCSAIIDDAIFCAHGGIPSGIKSLNDLNNIQCPLPDPEEQSAIAWEMLWNDPVDDEEFGQTAEGTRAQTGTAAMVDLFKTGFIANSKRGTANFYSMEAVRRFLSQNGLTHIIRAHEVCPQGYELKHKGRTITVFSSSKYGNGNNEAAVIFVDKSKIRPVRIDTNI